MMRITNYLPSIDPNLPNAQDLAYFVAMQEANPPNRPDHSAQMWNQRAEAWKKERKPGKKSGCTTARAMSASPAR